MKEIPLTKGKVALVDDVDYETLARMTWYAWPHGNTYYASSRSTGQLVQMHRFILQATPAVEIDHRSGDGLDNQRANLRSATRGQNVCNQRKRKDNTSGFKGVHWHSKRQRWATHICIEGRNTYLGLFDTPQEAALVYDDAARQVQGEFARLNFPGPGEQAA